MEDAKKLSSDNAVKLLEAACLKSLQNEKKKADWLNEHLPHCKETITIGIKTAIKRGETYYAYSNKFSGQYVDILTINIVAWLSESGYTIIRAGSHLTIEWN